MDMHKVELKKTVMQLFQPQTSSYKKVNKFT